MDRAELAGRIDHTVLGPTTTPADVDRVLRDAQRYGMNACVPPCYVTRAADTESDVTLATVIGFPQGLHTPETKRSEAGEAVSNGADELDVVMNVGWLQTGERDRVQEDLEGVIEAVSVPVKVIVESPLLSEAELHTASEIGVEAGADFLKTSTGFVEGGATVEDVEVMVEYLPVKASGGIGSFAEAKAMFEAGAERIGASSGTAIVDGFDGAT